MARPAAPSAAGGWGGRPKGIVLLLLFVIGAAIYLPTLSFDFLSLDDKRYIVSNPWIREFSLRNLTFIFSNPFFHNYQPLHLLSYMVDDALWGGKAYGFHLHSLLLHALNTALACLTLARLGSPWPVAAVAALLFAAHPSHVESVAWLSSRKDLLSFLFTLLAVNAYSTSRRRQRASVVPFLIALACFALALLSKMVVFLLPLFLLVWERLERRVEEQPREYPYPGAFRMLPFLAVAAFFLVVNSRAKTQDLLPSSPLEYLLVRCYAVWNYFLVLCGIASPRPVYDMPRFGFREADTYAALTGLLLAGIEVTVLWIGWKRRWRTPVLATSWMLFMLLPALAFPLPTYMADRHLYAPSLGFTWLVAALLNIAVGKIPRRTARLPAMAGLAVLLAGGLAASTWSYLPVWKDSGSFWTHVVATSSSRMARNALAVVRMNEKRFEEAEQLLRESGPEPDADTYRIWGLLYDKQGRYWDAIREYDKGVALCRESGCAAELAGALHFNRGVTFWRLREYRAAAMAYQEAFRLDPDNPDARVWAEKAGAQARRSGQSPR